SNFMTPKNLSKCVFGGTVANESAAYLIRYADLVFGNVDLVGRDVVAMIPSNMSSQTTHPSPLMEGSMKADHGKFVAKWLEQYIRLHNPVVEI
ncbi:UNVERIFIED_CONTAM: hypothetical protein HDU68_000415, partial [Siphonaria sp. JEL0065]